MHFPHFSVSANAVAKMRFIVRSLGKRHTNNTLLSERDVYFTRTRCCGLVRMKRVIFYDHSDSAEDTTAAAGKQQHMKTVLHATCTEAVAFRARARAGSRITWARRINNLCVTLAWKLGHIACVFFVCFFSLPLSFSRSAVLTDELLCRLYRRKQITNIRRCSFGRLLRLHVIFLIKTFFMPSHFSESTEHGLVCEIVRPH